MKRINQHRLFAAAAAALLMAGSVAVQAEPLTRAEVRAELAEWRAQGMLDRAGEAGATSDVLLARERFNETQSRVLIAKYELEQQQLAERTAATALPEIAAYTEAGPDGPQLVVISMNGEGMVDNVETVDLAAID